MGADGGAISRRHLRSGSPEAKPETKRVSDSLKMCSQGKTVRAQRNRDRAGKEARQRCDFKTSLTPHGELWSVGRTMEYGFLEVRDWTFIGPP